MLRKLSISRTIGSALVLFLVLTTLVVPVVAQDPTYSIELWLKADGSGHGVISAYLPAGGETSDQIVANLEGVGSLTGVTKKDLGGDNWEITLSWASFDQAFTPDSWTEMSGSVEASFDSLTQSYQETTVHLPGMITQSGTGTMLDSQTIVFSMGDTNAYVSFSATSGSPSPSSSTTSSSDAARFTVELWIQADGSGKATISAYLPPGGQTADEIVASLETESSFSGVTKVDRGNDNYDISFAWSDFELAFDPGSWLASASSVELDLGYLTESFDKTTVHLPGPLANSSSGTKLDETTIVFALGETTNMTITLAGGPTPSQSPTPKPTPSPKPSPTSSGSASPQPTSSIPVPTVTPHSSPSPSSPASTSSGGLPLWAIILIAVGGALVIVLIVLLVMRSGRRRPPPTRPSSVPRHRPGLLTDPSHPHPLLPVERVFVKTAVHGWTRVLPFAEPVGRLKAHHPPSTLLE
jgi:hypothetical protein